MEPSQTTPRNTKKRRLAPAVILLSFSAVLCLLVVGGFLLLHRMGASAPAIAPRPDASQTLSGETATEAAEQPAVPITGNVMEPIYEVPRKRDSVMNILLIGTDSRTGSGSQISGNADTVVLASFDTQRNTLTLVSFLRDIYLPINSETGEHGKLKTACTNGGVGALINALNSTFGLDIQSYVAVGLEGFISFVDETLGGLDLTLNQGEIDDINDRIAHFENEISAVKTCPPVTDPPGLVHLNGTQVLLFARNRSTPVDAQSAGEASDFDRVSRQQQVLETIYTRTVTEKPVSALPGLLGFAMGHIQTNLDAGTLSGLGTQLLTTGISPAFARVPFGDAWSYGGDGSGILFDWEDAAAQLDALLYPA